MIQTGGTSVAALAPCGTGESWYLPVIAAVGKERILSTVNGGRTWVAGGSFSVAGLTPAWSCLGPDLWTAAKAGGAQRLLRSADGGTTWSDRGPTPKDLTALAVTGNGIGFAASAGKHPTLWSVTGDGTRFTPLALPSWVATTGGHSSND